MIVLSNVSCLGLYSLVDITRHYYVQELEKAVGGLESA